MWRSEGPKRTGHIAGNVISSLETQAQSVVLDEGLETTSPRRYARLITAFCDYVYLDSDDNNLTIILSMTVLATRNLLVSMWTRTHQDFGGIGVTPNDSTEPVSDMYSTG